MFLMPVFHFNRIVAKRGVSGKQPLSRNSSQCKHNKVSKLRLSISHNLFSISQSHLKKESINICF